MVRRPRNVNPNIARLVDQFTPQIRDAFYTAIAGITDNVIISELVTAIELGDLNRAFSVTGINAAALRPITAMIEQAFETGGVTVAGTFPPVQMSTGGKTVIRFDVRNSRAEAWLRDHSSSLVTRITEEQQLNIRNVIQAGTREGINPRNVALDIVGRIDPATGRRVGGIVGLSGPQQQYVASAQAELSGQPPNSNYFNRERRDKRFDSTVQKAINDGVALDSTTVNKITGRYSDSLLQLRGETIARSEALQSLNESESEAYQQAIDTGGLKKSAVTKTWDSAGHDGRTRPTHLTLDGQTVQMDEPFVSESGARMMHPGDTGLGAPAEEIINCRCKVKYGVDWFDTFDVE